LVLELLELNRYENSRVTGVVLSPLSRKMIGAFASDFMGELAALSFSEQERFCIGLPL